MYCIYKKATMLLLGVNLFNTLIAQENKLLSPAEMKADADFYFESLYREHPNPYYYCSLEEFEDKKSRIYSQLDKSLTHAQFLWILHEINSCLDSHSLIRSTERVDGAKENQMRFPLVKYKDTKLFLADNPTDEITEVNGVSVEKILSEYQKYFNWKLPHRPNLNSFEANIPTIFHNCYNIQAPYEVKFSRKNEAEIINGISHKKLVDENYNFLGVRGEYIPNIYKACYYKIYPSHSVAIFYMNTFDNRYKNNFNDALFNFVNEVNSQKIKYIFYDLSKNRGGNNIGQYEAFDVVKHDTIYYRVNEIRRNNNINRKYKINDILLKPNYKDDVIPDSRQLFVLIGNMTASRGDNFCRVFADNKLGVLVGQDSGEPTKAFGITYPHTLPNSKFNFTIATMFLDFSDYFDGETLKPDLYWDVHHNREFTEKELMKIVSNYKK